MLVSRINKLHYLLLVILLIISCDEDPEDLIQPTTNPGQPATVSQGDSRVDTRHKGLAFDGAEGHGRFANGWKGGTVLVVSNLNDAGPGSLRSAIEYPGPSIIVFDVSGTIELESSLDEHDGNVYIAGQTSKYGITLVNHELNISASSCVVRHIKSRAGESSGRRVHAIQIWGRVNNIYDVIIDHVSASGGIDECVAVIGSPIRPTMFEVNNITISNSIIGPGFGGHGFGMLIKYNVDSISLIRNFYYGNIQRNPQWNGATGEMVNNVIANWRGLGATFKDDFRTGRNIHCDIIGNYAWAGSGSKWNQAYSMPSNTDQQLYLKENYHSRFRTDPYDDDEAAIFDKKILAEINHDDLNFISESRFVENGVLIMDVFEARDWVVENSGSIFRDAIDERVLNNFQQGISEFYTSQNELGVIPSVPNESRGIDWTSLEHAELERILDELANDI